jgi:hypothetical protein
VKHARFVDPARSELLAEISYYETKEPGLGGRFLAAVQEATARALAYPLTGTLRLWIAPMTWESLFLPWLITRAAQAIGTVGWMIAEKVVPRHHESC